MFCVLAYIVRTLWLLVWTKNSVPHQVHHMWSNVLYLAEMRATCSEIKLTFKVPGIYLGSVGEGKKPFVAGRLTWPIFMFTVLTRMSSAFCFDTQRKKSAAPQLREKFT